MTEKTEIYAGIEGRILVYHSPWYFKTAYFFRIISQTKKTVVVQELEKNVVFVHKAGGYEKVIPNEKRTDAKPRRMFKTFERPNLVKGRVEGSTNYLEVWNGTPCMEDPMH